MDESINYSAMRKEELIAHRMQVMNKISALDNFQKAKKIQLNSAYGAL